MEKSFRQASETTYIKEHSQSFMKKNGHKSNIYSELVEWVSLPVDNSLEMWYYCKNFHHNNLGKAATKKPNNFKDPLGFSKTVLIKSTYFEHDLAS